MIYLLYLKDYIEPNNIFQIKDDYKGNVYSCYNSKTQSRTWLSRTLTFKNAAYRHIPTLTKAIEHLKSHCREHSLDVGYVNLTKDYPELLI